MADVKKRRIKLRRLRRTINMGAAASSQNKAESVRRSQESAIRRHAKYPIIEAAFKEGISCNEIARWFAKEGWIDVNERTFSQYLQTFKRLNPQITEGGDEDSIDSLISANRPNVDTLTELNRLLRLQKMRLNIDVKLERDMGKLFDSTQKEIERANQILETMAKVKGEIGRPGNDSLIMDENTRDAVRSVRSDQGQRDRMYSLTEELVGALSNAAQKTSQTT